MGQVIQVLANQSAYLLPTLLALLELIQQQVFSTRTAQAAAAGVRSSGSSSRTSGRPSSSNHLQLGDEAASAGRLLQPLALALSTAAQLAPPMRPFLCYDALLEKKLRATWSQHSAALCQALDGCFRLQIGSSMGLSFASSACTLVHGLADSLLGRCDRPVAAAAVLAGPGSAEQRQLFGMLVSLLKVCGALSAVAAVDASFVGGLSPQQAAGDGCICAALTAAGCLSHRCNPLPDTHSFTGGMAACDAAGSSAPAAAAQSAAPAGQTEAAAAAAAPATAAATPIDSLPALVICGRCCLQWSVQLQVLQQQSSDLGERLLLLQQVNADSPEGAAELLQVHPKHAAVALFGGPGAWAAVVLRACRDWLSLGGTAEALAAAGYPAEALLQKLGVLLELLGQPAAAPDAAAAAAAYGQVVQQLQAVGLAFNTLAFPDACNKPFCSNMSGATELESVSGRANMCGGCLVARYCSKGCQASHWKQHKAVCKALRAAAVSDTATAD